MNNNYAVIFLFSFMAFIAICSGIYILWSEQKHKAEVIPVNIISEVLRVDYFRGRDPEGYIHGIYIYTLPDGTRLAGRPNSNSSFVVLPRIEVEKP